MKKIYLYALLKDSLEDFFWKTTGGISERNSKGTPDDIPGSVFEENLGEFLKKDPTRFSEVISGRVSDRFHDKKNSRKNIREKILEICSKEALKKIIEK